MKSGRGGWKYVTVTGAVIDPILASDERTMDRICLSAGSCPVCSLWFCMGLHCLTFKNCSSSMIWFWNSWTQVTRHSELWSLIRGLIRGVWFVVFDSAYWLQVTHTHNQGRPGLILLMEGLVQASEQHRMNPSLSLFSRSKTQPADQFKQRVHAPLKTRCIQWFIMLWLWNLVEGNIQYINILYININK